MHCGKRMDMEDEDLQSDNGYVSERYEDDQGRRGGGGLSNLFRSRGGRRTGGMLGGLLVLAVVIMSIVQLVYSIKTEKDFMQGNTTQASVDFKVVINITYIFIALGIISFLLFVFGYSRTAFIPFGSGGAALDLGRSGRGSTAYISTEE
jgi:small-conductance mechanosensitive channel